MMMAKCRDQNVPPAEHDHAMSLREHCAELGIKNGMISEELLDGLEIYFTPDSVRRDQLTACRQHAFLVTQSDSIARHRELEKQRSSEQREAYRQHSADLALVEKAEAATIKRNQREAQRVIERERLAAMAPEERRIVGQAAKAAAAERKRVKEHEKQLKIEAAKVRLHASKSKALEA